MKFEVKKYLYFLNDLTNMLLKKDIEDSRIQTEELHKKLKIVSIFLVLSLILNLALLIKIFIYA